MKIIVTRRLGGRLAVLGLSSILSVGIAVSDSKANQDGGTHKIGLALSLSGAGAKYGKLSRTAANIAVDEINAAGGIKGRKIELIVADTLGKPQEAVHATRRLVSQDKVIAIVGYTYSAEVLQAFPVGNQLKTPVISTSSATPGIMDKLRPWGFRNTLTEAEMQRSVVARWAKDFSIKNVAIVADTKDAYSKDLGTNLYPKVLAEAGLTVVNASSPITFSTGEIDFSSQVTSLKQLKFDGVAIGAQSDEIALFLKEMRRQGIKAPVVSGVGMLTQEFLNLSGPAGEGATVGSSFWIDNPNPASLAVVAAITEKSDGTPPDYRAAATYDTIKMLAQVMGDSAYPKDGSVDTQRDAVRNGLNAIKEYRGIMGSTSFNDVGDGVKESYILRDVGGKWTLVK